MIPEEILNKINNSGHYDYSLELLLEFGKNCFEAGKNMVGYFDVLEFKYDNFEDYLKELYENKN
jgi:hypothetical protein